MRHVVCLGAALFLAACKPSSERYAQSVTIDLPPAISVDSINLAETDPEHGPDRSRADMVAVPRPAPTPPEAAVEPQLAMASPAAAPPEPAVGETESAAVSADPAPAPSHPTLSDALIARTLARIGFPCGQVVAANPVDDTVAAPAWRIECSSGASYRGTDRNGRMRFKRW